MIIKKLAAPLINEKILHEAEHCYIATASISEPAFDFIKSRLHPKCKIDIVTGLDVATSPNVLKRIWRHYQDRITFHIYTKNFFHSNVYIFDLPYRKAVAFVGSGHFTLEGIKDHEEIFYKIKDPKEIEALKSWFIGYYEFAEPLTEAILTEYAEIFPSLKRHEIELRKEKEQFIALTTGGFHWDNIKFKNQYFKKEDYLVFSSQKAVQKSIDVQSERETVRDKFLALHNSLKDEIAKFKILGIESNNIFISSIEPSQHSEKKARALWITYSNGNDGDELSTYPSVPGQLNFMQLRILIQPKDVSIWLIPNKNDRKSFIEGMNDASIRGEFFKMLLGLKKESGQNEHWLEIAGDKKTVGDFQNEDAFFEFIKTDLELNYAFIIGRTFSPGAIEISNETINETLRKEVDKFALLYQHIKPSVV